MGRTRATTRDRLDALEREWTPFRRSLRRRHQPAFDRLFEHARGHAEAATQQNPADPWRGFVFAVLLAQERALAASEEEVTARDEEIEALEAELAARADEIETLEKTIATVEERVATLEEDVATLTEAIDADTDVDADAAAEPRE